MYYISTVKDDPPSREFCIPLVKGGGVGSAHTANSARVI